MSRVVARCAASTPARAKASRRAIERVVARDAKSGAVVGACAFWTRDDGATACVASLAVERAHRRRGVATSLVGAVERACARRGATRCALRVNRWNRGAISTYEKLGYVEDARVGGPMAWVMDPSALVQRGMSKPIGIEGDRRRGAARRGARFARIRVE